MLGMGGTARRGTRTTLPILLKSAILSIWPDVRRIAAGPRMDTYAHQNLDWYRDTLSGLFDLELQGDLDPRLARNVPLSNATNAHRMLEEGRMAGKFFLTIGI